MKVEIQLGGKSKGLDHSKRIFPKANAGVAYGSYELILYIGSAVIRVHEAVLALGYGIDRKVTARQILFYSGDKISGQQAALFILIAGSVGGKVYDYSRFTCHFAVLIDYLLYVFKSDDFKLFAENLCIGKQFFHVCKSGIGGDIPSERLFPRQRI